MSNFRIAKEFFEFHLPPHVQAKIDLSTLKPRKDTFIDHALGASRADMLFSVQFGKEIGYIYILLEHQSQPDRMMAFRLHKYMLQICGQHLKEYPKSQYLPLVYPLVYYTGQEKYSEPLTLWDLFTEPELAKSFFIEPFKLIELRTIEDKELRKKVWAGAVQYIMKRAYERDIFPFLQAIKPLLEEIGRQDFGCIQDIMCYTLEKAESDWKEGVIELFKEVVSEEKKGEIMSIADRFREEGAQLGEQRGVQKGLQQGVLQGIQKIAIKMLADGQSITFISRITGLSEAEIKDLQKNLDS